MKRQKEVIKHLKYNWSIIGGIFFILLSKPESLFSLIEIARIVIVFIFGTLTLAWIIFWFNKMRTKKNQKAFLIMLILLFPVVIYMMTIGNALGVTEKLVYGAIPLFLVIPLFVFILKNPSRIYKMITITLSSIAIFGIVFIFHGDFLLEITKEGIGQVRCSRVGGDYHGIRSGGVTCGISDTRGFEKNLFGVQIKVPEKENQIVTLLERKGNNLSGKILDSKTGDRLKGEIKVFPQETVKLKYRNVFVMPFVVEYLEDKVYYLGLFEAKSARGGLERKDEFYDSIIFIDSVYIAKNIKLGRTLLGKTGRFSDFIVQEYFTKKGKAFQLKYRINLFESSFELDQPCEKIADVITKRRGDGKKYEVCIFSNKYQCEIETYKKGDCMPVWYDMAELSDEAFYCVATGQSLKRKDELCFIWKSGIECPLTDYYNGKCN